MRMLYGHSPGLDLYLSYHPTNAKLMSSYQASSKILWVGEITERCTKYKAPDTLSELLSSHSENVLKKARLPVLSVLIFAEIILIKSLEN